MTPKIIRARILATPRRVAVLRGQFTGEHGDRLSIQHKSKVSYESVRKFNVVIFGIDECYQAAKRSERLAFQIV